jgi:hypothetical protein
VRRRQPHKGAALNAVQIAELLGRRHLKARDASRQSLPVVVPPVPIAISHCPAFYRV